MKRDANSVFQVECACLPRVLCTRGFFMSSNYFATIFSSAATNSGSSGVVELG